MEFWKAWDEASMEEGGEYKKWRVGWGLAAWRKTPRDDQEQGTLWLGEQAGRKTVTLQPSTESSNAWLRLGKGGGKALFCLIASPLNRMLLPQPFAASFKAWLPMSLQSEVQLARKRQLKVLGWFYRSDKSICFSADNGGGIWEAEIRRLYEFVWK